MGLKEERCFCQRDEIFKKEMEIHESSEIFTQLTDRVDKTYF